jgi:hypothetical protein
MQFQTPRVDRAGSDIGPKSQSDASRALWNDGPAYSSCLTVFSFWRNWSVGIIVMQSQGQTW